MTLTKIEAQTAEVNNAGGILYAESYTGTTTGSILVYGGTFNSISCTSDTYGGGGFYIDNTYLSLYLSNSTSGPVYMNSVTATKGQGGGFYIKNIATLSIIDGNF